MLGASTVGSEGLEGGTASGGVVATALGFLAALAWWVAAGGAEELLLGASTVGSEGVEGATTGCGGAATTPVTTAALVGLLQLDELAATFHHPLVADVDQEPEIAEEISP